MLPKIELLKSLLLADFPSGSSINLYGGEFYLVGDDANHILILDEDYKQVETIHLFDFPNKRIPKPEKADLEASVFITVDKKIHLLALGSASMEKRMKVFLIPIEQGGEQLKMFLYQEFVKRLKDQGIKEVNIEGITVIENQLVLASRGNEASPVNFLITTDNDFWQRQHESTIFISEINSSESGSGFLGISELCYVEASDLLFVTFSSEQTKNSYDDGVVGDSYIAWIENAKHKINTSNVKLDGILNLSEASEEFKGEKIEGICVERAVGNDFIIHLISDDDKGQSKLFKVQMAF